eukprot:SAG31_NODE_13033_length_898_cov_0.801001_1_plen_299_part_11
MTTEGGGWYALTLDSSVETVGGVIIGQQDGGNPWQKCADDVTRLYPKLNENVIPSSYSSGESFSRNLAYARQDGTTLTRKQLDIIRDQIGEMSTLSKMVATVADDTGSAIYLRNSDGGKHLLTPSANLSCGDSLGANGTLSVLYQWHSSYNESFVTGLASSFMISGLPHSFLLPSSVQVTVAPNGGGSSFGWSRREILVRPALAVDNCSAHALSCSRGLTDYGSRSEVVIEPQTEFEFSPINWNQSQNITVGILNNNIDQSADIGVYRLAIEHELSSTDLDFNISRTFGNLLFVAEDDV